MRLKFSHGIATLNMICTKFCLLMFILTLKMSVTDIYTKEKAPQIFRIHQRGVIQNQEVGTLKATDWNEYILILI